VLHTGTVLIAERFVDELLAAAPQVGVLVTENRDPDDGMVLLHLLLHDLLRLAVSAFRAGDAALVTSILVVTERGFRDGDEYVRNASRRVVRRARRGQRR